MSLDKFIAEVDAIETDLLGALDRLEQWLDQTYSRLHELRNMVQK